LHNELAQRSDSPNPSNFSLPGPKSNTFTSRPRGTGCAPGPGPFLRRTPTPLGRVQPSQGLGASQQPFSSHAIPPSPHRASKKGLYRGEGGGQQAAFFPPASSFFFSLEAGPPPPAVVKNGPGRGPRLLGGHTMSIPLSSSESHIRPIGGPTPQLFSVVKGICRLPAFFHLSSFRGFVVFSSPISF